MLFHRLNPCVALWTMMATTMMILSSNTRCSYVRAFHLQAQSRHRSFRRISSSSSLPSSSADLTSKSDKGKLLILGGTGFVGQTLCKRASLEGYSVTSLSRRGLPSPEGVTKSAPGGIDYRMGDASNIESITDLLDEGGYVGVVHCIGLLFDDASGIGNFNRFVSGSGSVPDPDSTYDTIIRQTAFNAIDATLQYVQQNNLSDSNFPFVFMSAAEAGWPDVLGGPQIEEFLAPEWLRRYLSAKRAVEAKLMARNNTSSTSASLRAVIPRPSLIYSLDRPASYGPVGAFIVGNKIGLPFVDRPVTVQSLANAIVRSIARDSVRGIQRFQQIDELNK